MNELSVVVVASDFLIPKCATFHLLFERQKTKNREQRAKRIRQVNEVEQIDMPN